MYIYHLEEVQLWKMIDLRLYLEFMFSDSKRQAIIYFVVPSLKQQKRKTLSQGHEASPCCYDWDRRLGF
jgi:hypothetical protein